MFYQCSSSTLAPDDVCKACSYRGQGSGSNGSGKSQRPVWRDPPGGQQYYPSFNIAPGSHTPVMISSKHYDEELGEITERVIQPMRWGLVPSWHKGDPNKVEYETNNCRSEGMLEKRTYKVPLEKGRRCVVLADGFFEWKRDKTTKQPYFIYFPKKSKNDSLEVKENIKTEALKTEQNIQNEDIAENVIIVKVKQEPLEEEAKNCGIETDTKISVKQEIQSGVKTEEFEFGAEEFKQERGDENLCLKDENDESGQHLLTMAGVFDVWNPPDGSPPLYSYSVITVAASPAMSWIHHRMPAILTCEDEVNDWLDYGNVPISKAAKLIRPVECIQLHPVSSVVNNSRNKTPDCVKPVDLEKPKRTASSNLMMGWLSKGNKDSKRVEQSPTKSTKGSPNKTSPSKQQNFMMGWLAKGKKDANQNIEEPPNKKQKTKESEK